MLSVVLFACAEVNGETPSCHMCAGVLLLCLLSLPGTLSVTSPPMPEQLTSYAVCHPLFMPLAFVPGKLT